MSIFRTILESQKADFDITHRDHIFNMGSCFAQHIGLKLEQAKFSATINPFGILYNPISIGNALQYLLSDNTFTADDLFQDQGLWHSFAHHGHFSDPNPDQARAKMNTALEKGRTQLRNANRILITLGTARVFHHIASDQTVANCHKLPAADFEERQLSTADINTILSPIFQQIHATKPNLEIIISVSPVRHLRDGFIDNQRSKASLLLALQAMSEELSFVNYFPAYELLMDDLRDYRFYEDDMTHPNHKAIEYIWTYFAETYFGEPTKELAARIEKIKQASQHRPFHPDSPEHQQFLQNQLKTVDLMQKEYAYLDFSKEKALFEKQLL